MTPYLLLRLSWYQKVSVYRVNLGFMFGKLGHILGYNMQGCKNRHQGPGLGYTILGKMPQLQLGQHLAVMRPPTPGRGEITASFIHSEYIFNLLI